MTGSTQRGLRERWAAERLAAYERELLEASRRPTMDFPESPFGRTESGLIDLRGARLSTPLRHVRVAGVDLSDVVFVDGASVNESELESCLLDRVDMRGAFVRRRFVDCSFVGAKLARTRLGGVFQDCDFSRANLSASVATGARFERCIFTATNLRSVMWTTRCVFEDCGFDDVASLSGTFAGSVFIRSAPADFGDSIIDHVRFEGIEAGDSRHDADPRGSGIHEGRR